MIRLQFGNGSVTLLERGLHADAPNQHGGIGNITGEVADSLWTGDIHLWLDRVAIPLGSITKADYRSNLNESDESWQMLWQKPEKFNYEDYFALAALLNSRSTT